MRRACAELTISYIVYKLRDVWKELKKKALSANHSSYIPKTPRKAIMRRFYLEKNYFKKEQISPLEQAKSRKNVAVDFIRKKEKGLSMG